MMQFELCLCFYYGYFVSAHNKKDILHGEWLPVFVSLIFAMVLRVPFNYEHRYTSVM
jgi:hypothetical protein